MSKIQIKIRNLDSTPDDSSILLLHSHVTHSSFLTVKLPYKPTRVVPACCFLTHMYRRKFLECHPTQNYSKQSTLTMEFLYDKIRNQYKGNKIQITLLIEYLKARKLFEIQITPQARLIMSSLNDSCCSNISNTFLRFESLHKQD